jgi:hypothetical protein
MLLPYRIIKKVLIWLAVNTLSAILFSFSLASYSASSSLFLFLSLFIMINITAFLCNITGNYLGKIFKLKSIFYELPVILTGTLCASAAGLIISYYITKILFGYPILGLNKSFFIISLLISGVITVIVVFYNHYKSMKYALEENRHNVKPALEANQQNNTFAIRENEKYHLINCDDLIYLSSHGRRTTLHARDKDYETNQLIKNIENKLPKNFMRVHKQFIINIKYLSRVEYYQGGRYLAYLNDDDESTLPVVRNIAPLLKEKIGIKNIN